MKGTYQGLLKFDDSTCGLLMAVIAKHTRTRSFHDQEVI